MRRVLTYFVATSKSGKETARRWRTRAEATKFFTDPMDGASRKERFNPTKQVEISYEDAFDLLQQVIAIPGGK